MHVLNQGITYLDNFLFSICQEDRPCSEPKVYYHTVERGKTDRASDKLEVYEGSYTTLSSEFLHHPTIQMIHEEL